jgi:hypothetical protein
MRERHVDGFYSDVWKKSPNGLRPTDEKQRGFIRGLHRSVGEAIVSLK